MLIHIESSRDANRALMLHNRKIRNRESAARSRERKKLSIEYLASEMQKMNNELKELKQKYEVLCEYVSAHFDNFPAPKLGV